MSAPTTNERLVAGLRFGGRRHPNKTEKQLIRRTYVLRKPAADGAAATETAYTAADQIRMPRACRVLGAYVQPQGALTAHADNYATVKVVKGNGAGGAEVIAASANTTIVGTDTWAAGATEALTVSATEANTQIPAGGVLSFSIAKAGTGVVVPICSITIDVEEEGVDGYA